MTINHGAEVRAAAAILPGVTIGEGTQIGAGAVVSEDIPPCDIAVGVPARVMRFRRRAP